jgi:hypothetical protein
MNLFYIKNPFSIILASEIISMTNSQDNIALIHDFKLKNLDNYQIKLTNGILINPFNEIIFETSPNIKKPIQFPFIKYVTNRLYLKKYHKLMISQYEKVLNITNVSKIYLSNVAIKDTELALYSLAKKFGIEVALFDEGLFHEYSRKHLYERKKSLASILILDWLSSLIFRKDSKILKFNSFHELSKIEMFENYFTLYPELFPYKTIKNIHKIDGNRIKNNLPSLDSPSSIFLSRPMSEDLIVTYRDELEVIKELIKHSNDKIFIKFHPRDSLEKKIELTDLFEGRILEGDYPVEYLINSPRLRTVYGFNTNALFFFSHYSDIKCISLLGRFGNDKINLLALNEYQRDFPNLFFL